MSTYIIARHVANTILDLSFKEKHPITPLHLQMMLYDIYKQYYQLTDQLPWTEPFVASRQGPVLMDIYHALLTETKQDQPILKYLPTYEEDLTLVKLHTYNPISHMIVSVWNSCKDTNPQVLLQKITTPGSAWEISRTKNFWYIQPSLIKRSDTP